MRRNDRSFRPTDPLVPAPPGVWALTLVLIAALALAAGLLAILT